MPRPKRGQTWEVQFLDDAIVFLILHVCGGQLEALVLYSESRAIPSGKVSKLHRDWLAPNSSFLPQMR